MPLLETPGPRQPTAADGAQRIRQMMYQTVSQMDQGLGQVRQVIQRHGRQAIAAELGPDAAELQTIYNKLKACLQDLDASREVPDLPS